MRYLKYLSALLIIALMLFQVTAAAYEGNGGSTSYTYDENGNDVSIPDAYTFKKSVDITDSERSARACCFRGDGENVCG